MSDINREQLQVQLNDLLQGIRIDERALARAKSVMQDVTQRLLSGLQCDYGIVRKFEYTGSSYEGTKIKSPDGSDEFDVMVVLDGGRNRGLTAHILTPGYAALSPRDSSASLFSQFLEPGTDYLSPAIVISKFFGMVQRQLNRTEFRERVTVSRHGPAVMLAIFADHGRIDVDLVPAFIVGEDLYVAKPYKNYADDAEDSLCGVPTALMWRKSTSLQEKGLLSRIDRDQGCRRKCLKVFKYIRTQDATLRRLTSFHFKTLVLRESETGGWRDSNMPERFMDLLRNLRDCLDRGRLRHYFIPEVNLLDGISYITMENIRGRVSSLINSELQRERILRYPPTPRSSYRTHLAVEEIPIQGNRNPDTDESSCLIL